MLYTATKSLKNYNIALQRNLRNIYRRNWIADEKDAF